METKQRLIKPVEFSRFLNPFNQSPFTNSKYRPIVKNNKIANFQAIFNELKEKCKGE